MSIMEPVKKGFATAKNSLNLVLVLFVFGAVFNLVNVFMAPQVAASPDTPPNIGASAGMIVVGVIFILLSIFVQAGSLGYIRDKMKQGKADLSVFLSSGGKYYLPMLLVGLLIAAIVGVFILLAALSVAFLANKANVVGIILAVILASIGIYIVVLMFLAPYLIVASDEKVIPAIKKSIELVRKNILTVLGIGLILIAIAFVFGLLIGIVLGFLSVAIKGILSQIIFAVLNSLLNAFLGVLVSASFMAFYLGVSAHSGNTTTTH